MANGYQHKFLAYQIPNNSKNVASIKYVWQKKSKSRKIKFEKGGQKVYLTTTLQILVGICPAFAGDKYWGRD